MSVAAELGEFQNVTGNFMVRDLLPEGHWYNDSYYAIAYQETDDGYLMKVLQVDDYRFVHNVLAMLALREQGFGGRGLRSTREFLDQDIRSWMASRGRPSHETVEMVIPGGDTVAIDVAIAPLLQSLWDQGVHTVFSCQGGNATPTGPNEGYIVYAADGHDVVVTALTGAGAKNIKFEAGPEGRPDLRKVCFDPIE